MRKEKRRARKKDGGKEVQKVEEEERECRREMRKQENWGSGRWREEEEGERTGEESMTGRGVPRSVRRDRDEKRGYESKGEGGSGDRM